MKMRIRRHLLSQFHDPHGALGHLAGWILATRGSNRERNAWTVNLLDIQPRDRVLELGFGPGLGIRRASQRASEGYVVGVDHSATMLQHARARNAAAVRANRVELIEGSLDQLPSFDQPFDKVFAVNSLQFSPDLLGVLKSIRERMRVGGRIAITLQSRAKNATDADSIRGAERGGALLEQVGFESVRVETLDLKPVCAACVLAEVASD
ncbi:MAG: class I SAM-dependent methyltransferase [bacterium]|nr:class I SAM-dependent methyltransferase [bacterium]